ncbi:hypothetical protein CWI38_1195p0020 [Hamiltosporidium tvaerminnensis]|uniref:Rad21/Rec8-like protein N-terminal domain-containing protein n=1 Tax=Hamiltosporidium tvaerminnensis TaxID=1176355 RepID=A0A4Q9LV37_9MICR|nr:hypothetical protein CWI38_1195p0020 [Hamiltosporidium tvaerminnensis]
MSNLQTFISQEKHLSLVWDVYQDVRKVTKSQIKEFELEEVKRKLIHYNTLRLPIWITSHFILGMAKILDKKGKYIFEDMMSIISIISKPRPKRSEHKNLRLAPFCRIQPVEPSEFAAEYENIEAADFLKDDFELEYDGPENYSHVEEAREASNMNLDSVIGEMSAMQSNSVHSNIIQNSFILHDSPNQSKESIAITDQKISKRRKIQFDRETQLDFDDLYFNQTNANNMILRKEKNLINDLFSKNISINSYLIDILKKKIEIESRQSVEVQRAETLLDTGFEPDFTTEYNYPSFAQDELDMSDENIYNDFFTIDSLPLEFTFQNIVEGLDNSKKALAFVALLELCNKNEIFATQDICTFNDILCCKSF